MNTLYGCTSIAPLYIHKCNDHILGKRNNRDMHHLRQRKERCVLFLLCYVSTKEIVIEVVICHCKFDVESACQRCFRKSPNSVKRKSPNSVKRNRNNGREQPRYIDVKRRLLSCMLCNQYGSFTWNGMYCDGPNHLPFVSAFTLLDGCRQIEYR